MSQPHATPPPVTGVEGPVSARAVVSENRFRELMAAVCAPVTVVTTTDDGVPHGVTVSAFASLSLRPPLVSVAIDASSAVLARIQRAGRFGVNVLSRSQEDLALTFARRGVDRFAAASWCYDQELPWLVGSAGWLVCELTQAVRGGDHILLFGLVTHAHRTEEPPLVYGNRLFGTHTGMVGQAPPSRSLGDSIAACAR
ncbi:MULTISPECIES: flavin reductase family protein [unclassified Streptomyces]|uniref:flavin reductase family protein n=1 Tax=unclassified Streptomyces TaxID=2593676 RepID=UPI00343032EC